MTAVEASYVASSSAPLQESAAEKNTELFVATPPSDAKGERRIKRLFIANRGEIACRIIATCRKLNIETVAIYTDP